MSIRIRISALLIGLMVLSISCSDDPGTPDDPQGETGTITVQVTPAPLSPTWILSGARSATGSGDSTLSAMPVGDYTLDWSDLNGYLTPPSTTETLATGETVIFEGVYLEIEERGTIIIDQTPDHLAGAVWSLEGPYDGAGSGDSTLVEMPVGDYTLTWSNVGGYLTPEAAALTLQHEGEITFDGTYTEGNFILLPAGSFTMGSPEDELEHQADENLHGVTLTTPFHISSMEITNQQYAALAQWALDNGHCTATATTVRDALDGSSRELLDLDDIDCEISFSDGLFVVDDWVENHPLAEVTWYGAVAYCDWLNLKLGEERAYHHITWECNGGDPYGAAGYRLPTEAEWEYACRAGSETPFANGEITDQWCDDPVLTEIGWYCGNAGDRSHQVGGKIPNDWGLYDMHGNLWEWCNDWYDSYGGGETDPTGGASGNYRVLRGGFWGDEARYCRSADRGSHFPNNSGRNRGFRPVRSASVE